MVKVHSAKTTEVRAPSSLWEKLNRICAQYVWIAAIIVGILAVFAYSNSLNGGIVFDDGEAIEKNADVRGETSLLQVFQDDFWGKPFTSNRSHKSYRPLTVLSFRMNYFFEGLGSTWGYHVVNVALHAINSMLVVPFVSNLCGTDSSLTAFIAAALFATHPIHTEAVSSIVGRSETFYTLFSLLGMIAFQRLVIFPSSTPSAAVGIVTRGSSSLGKFSSRGVVVALLCVVGATLAKDQGLMLALILVAFDWLYAGDLLREPGALTEKILGKIIPRRFVEMLSGKAEAQVGSGVTSKLSSVNKSLFARLFARNVFLRTISYFGIVAFGLGLRTALTGKHFIKPYFVDNPLMLVLDQPLSYYLTALFFQARYAWLLVWPVTLSCEYCYNEIPLIASLSDVRNLATLLCFSVLGGMIVLALLRRSKAMTISLALLIVPMLPASNLFFPVGTVIGERLLYLPSLGFCILLAMSVQYLCKRLPSSTGSQLVILSVVALVVALYFARTRARNPDWESSYSLFSSGVKATPGCSKLNWNHGLHIKNRDSKKMDVDSALGAFNRSLEIAPNHFQNSIQLAIILFRDAEEGKWDRYSRQLLNHHLNVSTFYHPNAHYYLGLLDVLEGKYADAQEHFAHCWRTPGGHPCAYNSGMVAAMYTKNYPQAEMLGNIAFTGSEEPQHKNLIGVAQAHQGQLEEAKRNIEWARDNSRSKDPLYTKNLAILNSAPPLKLNQLSVAFNPRPWGDLR